MVDRDLRQRPKSLSEDDLIDRDALSVSSAAREEPEGLALLGDDLHWTWAELARRVEQRRELLDRHLEADDGGASGARSGESIPLALVGDASPDGLLWIYCLLDAARPFVLLHPRWTPGEREQAMALAGVRHLLEGSEVQRLEAGADVGTSAEEISPSERRAPPDGSWACAVFTSGTTGTPRAALLERRAIVAAARASAANLGWQEDDRWLLNLPIAHVGGLSVVMRTLIARSTVVLSSSASFRARDFCSEASRFEVTLASLVPTMLQRIVRSALPADRPPSTLRALLLGGSRANPALVRHAREAGWPVLLTYGMTETGSQFATQRLAQARGAEGFSALPDDSVGRPLEGFEAEIRSGEGSLVPAGEVGHLAVRGEGLFAGYLGVPREETFDEKGWFATGDFAVQEAGELELRIVDRRRDLIITGGENVYPSEVEAALLQLPEIDDVCVVGVDDEEWGQRVGCAVVLAVGGTLEGAQRAARDRIATYRCPTVWRALDVLPRSGISKLDRAAVRTLLTEERHSEEQPSP